MKKYPLYLILPPKIKEPSGLTQREKRCGERKEEGSGEGEREEKGRGKNAPSQAMKSIISG